MASTLTLIILVALVFLAIFLLYVIYSFFTKTYLISSPQSIKTENGKRLKISYTQLQNPSSTRYTVSTWIFIESLPVVDRNLVLFNRENKFVLYLNGRNLYLTGDMSPQNVSVQSDGVVVINPNFKNIMAITDNFLFQKWVSIIISVDGNVIDVYLDGHFTKSKQMVLPPPNAVDDIYMGNNYLYGQTTRTYVDSTPYNPQDVNSMVQSGSGVPKSSSSTYNVNMDLEKNGVVQKTFKII